MVDCGIRNRVGWSRGPAGEQVEGVLGWRPGLGGVDEDPLAGVAGQFEGFVGEGEVADDGVMEAFWCRCGGT